MGLRLKIKTGNIIIALDLSVLEMKLKLLVSVLSIWLKSETRFLMKLIYFAARIKLMY